MGQGIERGTGRRIGDAMGRKRRGGIGLGTGQRTVRKTGAAMSHGTRTQTRRRNEIARRTGIVDETAHAPGIGDAETSLKKADVHARPYPTVRASHARAHLPYQHLRHRNDADRHARTPVHVQPRPTKKLSSLSHRRKSRSVASTILPKHPRSMEERRPTRRSPTSSLPVR
jgi:hypothetical protein